ncbi:DUF6602 domain-containing protein [Tenacibaculum maritimum]|uniref:DUF6602 domain-containing protein n=1 Tax=Tenacibaculum maritimum TaxID=107401 RepID=UPI0012E54499|nr:DUF6602 domain-containing protein [Tenacibaculum maritimum]CAA0199141.1 conserved hypothetical protein [Tenacibaculum maritimum]
MNKIDLKSLFSGLQNQMTSQLNTNREFITHPGSKGDALENAWIEWLQKYLPNRYSVDKAIIIDSEGNTSHQMDIVIYDNWFTPFIFSQNGFHYIPAEGVYAVFEVKPDINGSVEKKSYIEYAADKIESVRKLKRTSTNMINSGKKLPARPLTKIIGGILTSTNSFTHKNNDTIISHIKKHEGVKGIDIGCIADYGCFYVDYIGEEDTSSNNLDERYLNYYNNRIINKVIFSNKENSLVSFFLQLTRYLQQAIGTVPAIDLNSYSQAINFTIDEEI